MATEIPENSSIVGDAVAAGVALAEPKAFGIQGGPASMPFIVVPKGYTLQNLEALYPAPYRKKGGITLNDPESFIAMVNDQAGPGMKVYGTARPQPSFLAVFNDHGGADELAAAGWRDHWAKYDCPLSIEWQAWIGKNKVPMNQQQFAEFIEDNEVDILVPESDRVPTMKEVATQIEATKNAAVTQGTRLDNGQVQFGYSEEVSGTVKKGKFEVPQEFRIAIPVFEGGEKIEMAVRFRYRVGSGGFTLFYDIVRPHKVLEDATDRIWKLIEGGTKLTIFHGR